MRLLEFVGISVLVLSASAVAACGATSPADDPSVDNRDGGPATDTGGGSDQDSAMPEPDSGSGGPPDGSTHPDGATTFVCGTSTICTTATEYCRLQGGGPDIRPTCEKIPASCRVNPSCACVAPLADDGGSGPTCTDNGGEITVVACPVCT
jgi:hypothetical protein